MRIDGRKNNELRKITVTRDFITTAEGSVLIEVGNTRVICTASIEERVPPFLRDQKKGWVTAEYGMLPRSTGSRMTRESTSGRVGGRTQEIQRLIGRSLRAVIDQRLLGERTVWIDCDVIQADGGTRTASITGAFIALSDALSIAIKKGLLENNPIKDYLAAISVGIARAAQLGILLRGGAAIETASRITTVLLDKTGTLTTGEPRVVDIVPQPGVNEERLLHLAALVEVGSEHPLGRAVVRAAQDRGLDLRDAPASTVVPGHGLTAQVDGHTVAIGTIAWLKSLGVAVEAFTSEAERLGQGGRTPLIVAIDGVAAGVLGVLDTPTPAARQAVADLLTLGVDVAMVTGDRTAVAEAVARDLGISTVYAQTTPERKAELVTEAQARGRVVAMVGDGLNDAPAVAGANLGIAMGSGTQVAQAAADVVLAQGGIAALPATLHIARATTRAIRQNLGWAFAFNLLGIPIAAGVLVPITGWSLSPMIASAAMALSSTMVLLNAWRLRFALRRRAMG